MWSKEDKLMSKQDTMAEYLTCLPNTANNNTTIMLVSAV